MTSSPLEKPSLIASPPPPFGGLWPTSRGGGVASKSEETAPPWVTRCLWGCASDCLSKPLPRQRQHPSIATAAVAPPLWPRKPEEATKILQACVVAWPGVAWHGEVLAEVSYPYPYPYPYPQQQQLLHRAKTIFSKTQHRATRLKRASNAIHPSLPPTFPPFGCASSIPPYIPPTVSVHTSHPKPWGGYGMTPCPYFNSGPTSLKANLAPGSSPIINIVCSSQA